MLPLLAAAPPNVLRKSAKSTYLRHIPFLLLVCLILGSRSSVQGQTAPNPVVFTWENEVGCIEGATPKRSYEESIASGICHVVCQGSTVKYTLSGSGLSNTVWTVIGGTILSQNILQCTVKWSSTLATGAIGVTTNAPTGIIEFIPICVQMKTTPNANFGKDGQELLEDPLVICRNTTVNFTNLSDANGGTPINASFWDFGDGGTSTTTNPSYTFTRSGEFVVILQVTNQCFCTSQYARTVIVTEESAIEITCPTVVCEGQTATYSISNEYQCEDYKWTVEGGTIISNQPYSNTVEVLWEPINTIPNESGFGYVTFDPAKCNVKCLKPTTVKIPIIQSEGTILGKGIICGSSQELYSLPQWPATEFEWTLANTGGTNASLVLTGQRNEVMINSGTAGGSFTLSCQYQNTLLKCGGIASITVQIRVPAIIQGNRVVCLQESGTTEFYNLESGQLATWRWRKLPNGPLSAPIVGTSVNPQFLTAGDYSITASGAMFCKSETFLVKVIDPSTLTPSGLLTSTVICPATPTTFQFTNTVPNSELHWTVIGGSIIGATTGNSIEVVFNYPYAQPYALKIKRRVNNCFSPELTIPLVLPVITDPIMGATALEQPIVYTRGSTSQSYTMPFTGADSYTWRIDPPSVGSLSTANGTNTVTVLWNEYSEPTDAFLYVDINNCGIITTKEILVTVGSPVITMTPITTTICSQNSQPFSIISTPPLTSGTVEWDFGDGGETGTGTTTQHTYNINDTSPTSYTVTATINNPNGCTTPSVVTQVINVALAPVALITPAGQRTACNMIDLDPGAKILVATLQSGYGITTGIQWFKDDLPITNTNLNQYQFNVTDFGIYYAVVTNGTCSSQTNKVVFEKNCIEPEECTITPDPNLTLSISGDCGIFNATAGYTGSPTIVWSISGKTASNSTSASYSFSKAGYYSIGYQAIYTVNGLPCRASISEPLVVPYMAGIKYAANCPAGSGNYSVTLMDSSTYLPFVQNLTYEFYVNDVLVPYTTGLATQRTVSLAPGATYNLKVVIQGQNLDACSKTISVTLPALPSASFTLPSGPYCQNSPISFTTPTQPGNTYEWIFDNDFSNKQQNPTISFTTGGIKMIKLKVTNSLGCSATTEQSIIVTPTNFAGNINPTLGTACANGFVNLSFDATLGNPVNFQWMKGDQAVGGTQTNPIAVNQPGRYWVKVGTNNGCYKDIYKPVAVSILPPIVPQISGRNAVCTGDVLTLSTNFTANGATYHWTVQQPLMGSSFVSAQQVFEYEMTEPGVYVFSLTVQVPNSNSGFCTGSATHTVTVYEAPANPIITPTLSSCQPYRIRLSATNAQSGSFVWSNGTIGTPISPFESQIIVNEGGPYQVTFTNASGCSAIAAVNVPRSLESYMWVFPTGCIDYCSDKYDGRYLIGPSVMEFEQWDWLIDSTIEATGNGEVASFPVNDSGLYNLSLYNEFCSFRSDGLQVVNQECAECAEAVQVIVQDNTLDYAPFLIYYLTLEITSNLPTPVVLTFTANSNIGIFDSATVMVQPGTDIYQIRFIPFSAFNPLSTDVTIEFNNQGRPCTIVQNIIFPNPNALKESPTEEDQLLIAPNPAKHSTVVTYSFASYKQDVQLLLYDLTGRFLDAHRCTSMSGSWNLDTSHLAIGQYVIVMKQNGQTIQQQHLIIKP